MQTNITYRFVTNQATWVSEFFCSTRQGNISHLSCCCGWVNGIKCYALLDTGAGSLYLSSAFLDHPRIRQLREDFQTHRLALSDNSDNKNIPTSEWFITSYKFAGKNCYNVIGILWQTWRSDASCWAAPFLLLLCVFWYSLANQTPPWAMQTKSRPICGDSSRQIILLGLVRHFSPAAAETLARVMDSLPDYFFSAET